MCLVGKLRLRATSTCKGHQESKLGSGLLMRPRSPLLPAELSSPPLSLLCPAGGRLTWSTAVPLVLFVWLSSAFWAALPLLGWGRYDYEPLGTCCTLDYSTGDR